MSQLSKNNVYLLSVFYFLVAGIHSFFVWDDYYYGRFVTRLLVPLLLLIIYFNASDRKNYWYIIGIIASLFSAFFLNFSGDLFSILAIFFLLFTG